jgi:CRISPR-associated endonuclease/helicase Cas3
VRVDRLGTVEEGEAAALDLAARGSAVALIRSTVDAAIESFDRLSKETVGRSIEIELFHARFLPLHRDDIEQRVMDRFGKEGVSAGRRRRILVATQVIEQSLDLDFDAMITDLAPIDLLIQRAGRLWRHRFRDPERPLSEPVLRVISPDPMGEVGRDWLEKELREAWLVYRDAALLWRSATVLFDAGRIVSGQLAEDEANEAHVRRLVEAVYKDGFDRLTDDLLEEALKAEGDQLGARALAKQLLLSPAEPYGPSVRAWASDTIVQTRLDDGSRAVRLGVEKGGQIEPLGGGEDWIASELRLRPRYASKLTAPTPDELARLSPAWAEADQTVLLLVMEGNAEDARSSGDPPLRYTRRTGLCPE